MTARENPNVESVVFSNRQYNILEVEYLRIGFHQVSDRAAAIFNWNDPPLVWVALDRGQDLPRTKAGTSEEFTDALDSVLSEYGSYLIEADL